MLFLLCLMTVSFTAFAADGCDDFPGDKDPIINPGSPIVFWGEDYQACQYYEWHLFFPEEWEYVEFDYVLDLNLSGAIDALMIYAADESGTEVEQLHYEYSPKAGKLTIPLYYTSMVRVVFISEYGNLGGMYKGLKLYYRKGSAVSSEQVFFSNVGIGIYPQERLHVNGPIRGGGTNGEVTLKGNNGSVTIGAVDTLSMMFNTDREQFVFNKPIQGSGEYGSLRIRTTTGNLEFGPMDAGNVRFKTNGTGYHFDRGITIANGNLISSTKLTFNTATSNNCMTILTNGNVGIGTINPTYKLDVAGSIRAQELIVETIGADFVFADDYQLRPLSEVKAFIAENKHLPEIQSAQEMQENGVSVSELQTQLLQKIEELTLYILQQEERIRFLEAEIGK